MKIIHILAVLFIFTVFLFGNDGAYTLSGNQIIPINETNISIEKEILKIKRIKPNIIDIVVEYTLLNPSDPKDIMVGFEANEPYGDINTKNECPNVIKNGHPCIYFFSVIVNDENVDFIVHFTENVYAYMFQAHFKKGINHIKHHYIYENGGNVLCNYTFDYILTAAKRWAKRTIKDFTLVLDMGDNTQYEMPNSFFQDGSEWEINGTYIAIRSEYFDASIVTHFHIVKSPAIFRKKNFIPSGDLELASLKKFMRTKK